MNRHRSRVAMTIHAGEASRAIAVGQVVDFDDPIGAATLGECVDPQHFEAEPTQEPKPVTPARRGSGGAFATEGPKEQTS